LPIWGTYVVPVRRNDQSRHRDLRRVEVDPREIPALEVVLGGSVWRVKDPRVTTPARVDHVAQGSYRRSLWLTGLSEDRKAMLSPPGMVRNLSRSYLGPPTRRAHGEDGPAGPFRRIKHQASTSARRARFLAVRSSVSQRSSSWRCALSSTCPCPRLPSPSLAPLPPQGEREDHEAA
jgi:hypothetical protein